MFKRFTAILLSTVFFTFVTVAVFSGGQAEASWHVVDGGHGELYLFTESVDGCGMFSIDFVEGKKVEYHVNCDTTIDASSCAKVCIHSNSGVLCEEVWQETEDHTEVNMIEDQPSAFLSKLESTDAVEINVATCDGKPFDHTFSLKGLARIMKDHGVPTVRSLG